MGFGMGLLGLVMACYRGLYGIPTGLTRSLLGVLIQVVWLKVQIAQSRPWCNYILRRRVQSQGQCGSFQKSGPYYRLQIVGRLF